jgi:hypothetical protein
MSLRIPGRYPFQARLADLVSVFDQCGDDARQFLARLPHDCVPVPLQLVRSHFMDSCHEVEALMRQLYVEVGGPWAGQGGPDGLLIRRASKDVFELSRRSPAKNWSAAPGHPVKRSTGGTVFGGISPF